MSWMNMPIPGLIILSCWIIFLVYWLISSFAVKPTAERKSYGSSLPYRILFSLGWVLTIKYNWAFPFLEKPLTPHNAVTGALAATICVVGLAITLWSRWTLADNWSSDVRFKQDHQLIRTGPYRFARHPIYTGILLMCSAPPIQFGRLHSWLGFLFIILGLWLKLQQEESLMLQHFPEYADYRRKVKALVPYVI
jgi:protein-S-isoprenylcysteine O-methyltransferase Ste14